MAEARRPAIDKAEKGPNGLPVMWSEARSLGASGEMTHVTCIMEKILLYPAAYGIYVLCIGHFKWAVTDDKIALLKSYDLGYLYLAVVLASWIKMFMTQMTVKYRARAPVNAPEQHIYQISTVGVNKGAFVLMASDGYPGQFNRAQRAVANYSEYETKFLLLIGLAGFIFPQAVLMLVGVIFLVRVPQVDAFAKHPDGRSGAFMIHVHLVTPLLEGLCFVAGVKSFM